MSGQLVGRCEMFDAIAHGSTATIHLGRMLGAGGFSRTVAIKRLHPQFACDQEFVARLRDEARLLARIRHPNVVPMLDLIEEDGDLYLILEYVEGVNLARLLESAASLGERVPPPIALRIGVGMLHGLHAAHEATDARGEPLKVVHRDVSPPNVLVGTDGFTRLLDFGTARALGRLSASRTGQLKRRSSYLSPEQTRAKPLDRRTDVFAVGVVLWECLTGRKLFDASDLLELAAQITSHPIVPPSKAAIGVPRKWDGIIMRALDRAPERRWKTAMAMADAIEAIGGLAQQRETGDWVGQLGAERIQELATKVQALETKPVRPEAKRRVRPRSQLRIDTKDLASAVVRAAAAEGAPGPSEHAAPPSDPPSAATSAPPPGPEATAAAGEISAPEARPDGPSPTVATDDDGGAAPDVARAVPGARAQSASRSLTAIETEAPPEAPQAGRTKLWLVATAMAAVGAVAIAVTMQSSDSDTVDHGSPSPERSPASVASRLGAAGGSVAVEPPESTAVPTAAPASTGSDTGSAPSASADAAPPATETSAATAAPRTTTPAHNRPAPAATPQVPLYSRD